MQCVVDRTSRLEKEVPRWLAAEVRKVLSPPVCLAKRKRAWAKDSV